MMSFYVCEKCGNMVSMIVESGMSMMCCGQNMTELIPAMADGAAEKHVPVFSVVDGLVTVLVGSVDHPMKDDHYIKWIAVETGQGTQLKQLTPGGKPCVQFALTKGDFVKSVYAYCNIHGLWVSVNADRSLSESCMT